MQSGMGDLAAADTVPHHQGPVLALPVESCTELDCSAASYPCFAQSKTIPCVG